MKQIPSIGTRVKYSHRDRQCSGEVVAIYRGGDRHKDPETGEWYVTEDHVGVRVDQPLPPWWPYIGKDRFAPSINELEPTK